MWQGRPAAKLSTEFVDNSVQNFAGTLAGTGLALVCAYFEQPVLGKNSIKIISLGRICWLSGQPRQKCPDAVSLRPATYALWTGTHRKAL
jgi:hypothetical protein